MPELRRQDLAHLMRNGAVTYAAIDDRLRRQRRRRTLLRVLIVAAIAGVTWFLVG